MITRFLLQGLIGLIACPAILYFGQKGQIALALIALIPLLLLNKKYRKSPDEREAQLFYKTSNYTLGAVILSMVAVYHYSPVAVNGHVIGDSWMQLCIALMLLMQGAIGLIVLKTQ
jgi:hypothetical protein